MSRKSKQYNYYVNENEEKELYDFLETFPKMTRSSFVKELIKSHISSNRVTSDVRSNIIGVSGQFEIDIEDI